MHEVVVITTVRGRHDHLALQRAGLRRSTRDVGHVVVAMGDDVSTVLDGDGGPPTYVVDIPAGGELPLAAARNLGAATALELGAHVLIFLDVDCVPSPELVTAYETTAHDRRYTESLLSGPVAYLPEPGPGGYVLDELDFLAEPHPARPAPPPGEVWPDGEPRLFWSLSFAVTTPVWCRINGFDESYVGYGGEDTDFALRADRLGIRPAWVGAARSVHQWHPVSDPPVEHREAIVRNATLFHERWGEWPMQGWLDAFVAEGSVLPPDEEGGYRLVPVRV